MEISLTKIGKDIKNYRLEAGMSQEDLSLICGIDRGQLSRIESGEVLGVTYLTIEKILNSLGRTIEYVEIEKKKEIVNLKPFVKWAGGKTQLLSMIEKNMPKEFNTYFEPFVGGGALLFKLQPQKFYINDLNEELILVYKCFETDSLFNALKKELIKHENNHSEDYYYKIREEDRYELFKTYPIYVRAARVVYLNKACFNGLYRVNKSGYFNVPFGKKKTIKCFDRENFEEIRNFFKTHKPIITNSDFETAVKDAKKGDFIYFDPPYDVLDNKKTFTSYDKDSFTKNDQIRLANLFKDLSKKGVYLMLSNHNTSFIRELYKDFNIKVIPAKRMINSKADKRGDVEEVLITNYE